MSSYKKTKYLQYLRKYCPPELLQEMLNICGQEITNNNNQVLHEWLSSKKCTNSVVAYIFDVCDTVVPTMATAIKYAAVDLYERFTEAHVIDIENQLKEEHFSLDVRTDSRENLVRQCVLRVITCVIIVVKYHTGCVESVRNVFENCLDFAVQFIPGVSKKVLVKSEERVLKVIINSTLDHILN